jgi:hypothetical protein
VINLEVNRGVCVLRVRQTNLPDDRQDKAKQQTKRMTPEENINFMRWQISTSAKIQALKTICGSLIQTVRPNDDFERVFTHFYDHYRADELSALQALDADLFQKVDDFDWDSYDPLEL